MADVRNVLRVVSWAQGLLAMLAAAGAAAAASSAASAADSAIASPPRIFTIKRRSKGGLAQQGCRASAAAKSRAVSPLAGHRRPAAPPIIVRRLIPLEQ